MKRRKAIFTQLVLDEQSRNVLRRAVGSLSLLPNEKNHHLTLRFKPSVGQVVALGDRLGESVEFIATGYAADHRVQAVACTLPDSLGLGCDKATPHVTLATGNDAEGNPISPVTSNEVLGWGVHWFGTPIKLTGVVGFFDGKEDRTDFDGTIYESVS